MPSILDIIITASRKSSPSVTGMAQNNIIYLLPNLFESETHERLPTALKVIRNIMLSIRPYLESVPKPASVKIFGP